MTTRLSKLFHPRRVAVTAIVFLLVVVPLSMATAQPPSTLMDYETGDAVGHPESAAGALDAWRERRFGMFIHWGPSAGRNLPHSHARKSRFKNSGTVEPEVYDQFYKEFNPEHYDADAWMKLAHDAGMRYVIFTAKHHDGFSMFDSAATEYDIMSTPYGRDVCKDLAEACQKQGLSLGWYYSPRDWYHPDFDTENHARYNAFYLQQLRELAGNYGPIDVMWFDGTGPTGADKWGDTFKLSGQLLRELQPGILLNPRGGLTPDFETFEKRLGSFDREHPWEMCNTLTDSGWVYRSEAMAVRPFSELIRELVYCVGRDGNYLLNIGPMPDGRIDPKHAAMLERIGKWMEVHGEAVYGTRGGPFIDGPWGASTCKGNTIYLYVTENTPRSLALPPIDALVQSARKLGGEAVEFEQSESGIRIQVDPVDGVAVAEVIALTLDRPAFALETQWVQVSLAEGKPATASSVRGKPEQAGPQFAVDSDPQTVWDDDWSQKESWLEVDLGQPQVIGSARVTQIPGWNPIRDFELQRKQGDAWVTFHKGGNPCEKPFQSFEPVEARHVRLKFTKHAEKAQISDFRLYAPMATAAKQ